MPSDRVLRTHTIEMMLERATNAARADGQALRDALDELPAASYVTNADGIVTYFNAACIDFSGRRPEVGADRWCVTWRLYTDAGEFLPHDECPMAVAINTRRPIRGMTALAERPDGTRVNFRPHPTPIFDGDGTFVGAVNILEDVTDEVRADEFVAQARRCRRLVVGIDHKIAAAALLGMAEEYDAKAAALGERASART